MSHANNSRENIKNSMKKPEVGKGSVNLQMSEACLCKNEGKTKKY